MAPYGFAFNSYPPSTNEGLQDHVYMLKHNVGAILVAPSVLPQYNPAVRVIQYDSGECQLASSSDVRSMLTGGFASDTYQMMNVITYWGNLDAANAKGNMTWQKEYDLVSAYGLTPPLTTDQFVSLKLKIDSDPATAKLYNYYKTVSSGLSHRASRCGQK